MNTRQPTLQQGDNAVNPRKQLARRSCAMFDDSRLVAETFQSAISRPAVSDHHASRLDALPYEPMQSRPVEIIDTTHADSPDPRAVLLSGHDDQRLVFDQSAHNALFFCSPVGFVNFHTTRQTIPPRTDHCSAQLVQHCPGRLVAAQTQYPLDAQRTRSVFLACYQPYSPEPKDHGSRVSWKMVPAVTDTWWRQPPHNHRFLTIGQAFLPRQRGQMNPFGHRRANRYSRHACSVENRRSSSISVRG